MLLRFLTETHQFLWSLESHHQQRLAWKDAAEARIARAKADARAAEQMEAMLKANPSGSLGHSRLNDTDALKKDGLL
ncbi:hypothetical protein DEM25_003680 [Oceaniradius stylonematis]|uniref:Uncharacterized protein n=2 Tax=Oceaniradius stylonematis TaxID=2184161 RepID=A0A3A8AEM7_9HYPH|nr:hypothetical protein DEM25_003680 [Oceaniradius stylonematis]